MTATRLRVIECGRTSLDYELAVTGHPDSNRGYRAFPDSSATSSVASDCER